MARAAQSAGASAKPKSPRRQEPVKQATNVMAMLDVVGALGSGTLSQSLYLFDNNRREGSTGHGTSSLKTVAQQGDVVVWTTMALECEAFTRLDRVEIDVAYAEYVTLDAGAFSETPEVYWFAKILKPLPATSIPYHLSYRLGSAPEPYRAPTASLLIPPPTSPTPGETPLEPKQEDAK